MPSSIALIVWLVCLVALWRFDPAKLPNTSMTLYVPLIWLFIVASRLPSQWLGSSIGQSAEDLQEGNPFDRIILFGLIVLAAVVLKQRSLKISRVLELNMALTAFLAFALLSAVWSDFPFIAFKRWIRDLGNYLVILVVLTDSQPFEAFSTVIRRLCYILIPLCELLNKYFPEMSKQYDVWSGRGYFVGVTTSKNMLGVLCLVSGLFFFWDTLIRWSKRKDRRTRRIIMVNIAMLSMSLWLLYLSDSATSRACLALGCVIIAGVRLKSMRRHPRLVKNLVPAAILLYLIVTFVFQIDIRAELAGAVGRDPTLTGRTDIWTTVLSMHTNPIVGTGYESFWLGPRLLEVWRLAGPINEAHNGYLETYLNLGIIGVALLIIFLISTYKSICKQLDASSDMGSMLLALWIILIVYNFTESAFKGQLMWLIFLLGVIVVPAKARKSRVRSSDLNEARSEAMRLSVG